MQLRRFLLSGDGWPYLLVPFIPIAVALDLAHAGAALVFTASALGVIPTAALMGRATDELANRSGPGIGGLLNVTFGNAPELIICLFALQKGLQEVVKASLVGSILGNILLVMGAAMFFGGLKRDRQHFDRTAASVQALMLLLAASALAMPAIFQLVSGGGLPAPAAESVKFSGDIEHLSVLVAGVLLVTYVAGLIFSLKTHRDLFNPEHYGDDEEGEPWSVRKAVAWLAVAGIAVGVMSEILVGSIEEASHVDRAVLVLRRRDRGGDRRQRRRALGRGVLRDEGQDGPVGQHRDRLERADRAVRRTGARAHLARSSARIRCRWSSTGSSSGRSSSRS